MGISLVARVAPVAALVALAACGQGATGRPSSTATAPFGAPVVSLATRGAGATRVVGGTPAMRARARAILDGMGDVAITAVRFRHANGATWLSTTVAGAGSPFADDDGNIQVQPGNRIPAVPRNRVKFGIDYSVTDAFKVGGDALFVASQYFAGDESNQAVRLPGYSVFNVHASYQINKTYQIYGRVDNIFDNRYATYGTFFERGDVPNFANGGAEFTDPRTVSPARPRAFYAGLKATF